MNLVSQALSCIEYLLLWEVCNSDELISKQVASKWQKSQRETEYYESIGSFRHQLGNIVIVLFVMIVF